MQPQADYNYTDPTAATANDAAEAAAYTTAATGVSTYCCLYCYC